jgi:hypothetical protein
LKRQDGESYIIKGDISPGKFVQTASKRLRIICNEKTKIAGGDSREGIGNSQGWLLFLS